MISGRARRLRIRPGLRARITIAFGLIALGLSAGLSLAAWGWVSHYLMNREEAKDLAEISDNAAALEKGPDLDRSGTTNPLAALPVTDHSASLLLHDGTWYSTSQTIGRQTVPTAMLRGVRDGSVTEQKVDVAGDQALVVGVPLRHSADAYFEVFPLDELERTLHDLSVILLGAGCGAAALGLGLGRLAGRRALRPLDAFAAAARAVANGDLDARMPMTREPDLAELASSFNTTAEALKRRITADARFAADVSHELRTPVTTMVNSMHLITSLDESLPTRLEEPIRLLAGDLERFRRLVVDLLEISRDDSADDGSTREPVRIAELVARAADGTAGRTVTVLGPSVPGIVCEVDKRRLERAVANLVENAERHGGGCRAVTVEASDEGVVVIVDDNGPGIPGEQRTRIFDRFARLGPDDGAGTGLGLAIVDRHVRWHAGTVEVTDAPSGGARFVVRLPAGPDAGDAARPAGTAAGEVSDKASRPTGRSARRGWLTA